MNTLLIVAGIGYGFLGAAVAAAGTYRQRWQAAARTLRGSTWADTETVRLADWAADTKITVNTVTGAWVSMTLAEVANSSAPHRSWNVPTSVRLHPAREQWGVIDEDQAKEHRG